MARRCKGLSVRDEFLILTNGKGSEKNYFELLRASKKSIFKIKVKFLNDSPEDLVKHAVDEKNNVNRVWCVFDKDDFQDQSIIKALKTANENDINIAFSNISFEVWILNHFKMVSSPKTVDQLIDEINKELVKCKYNKGYQKNDKNVINEILIPRLDEAKHNADIKYQKLIGEYREKGYNRFNFPVCAWNPFTTVQKLIDAMELEDKDCD